MINVQPTATGELVVSMGTPAQMTARYVETAPLVYTSLDTPPSIFGKLVFRADAQGNVIHLFQENNPTTAYVEAPWYGAGGFNLTLLLLCLLPRWQYATR